jgi:integrase/recombinase XerC
MSLPAIITKPTAPPAPIVDDAALLSAFMASLGPHTRDAYDRDYRDFARRMHLGSPKAAIARLLGFGSAAGNLIVLEYRNQLTAARLATATIARRLAALRSIVRMGRTLGRIEWTIEIRSPRLEQYRDTAGPGDQGWIKMIAVAAARTDAKGRRDLAVIRLLHDLALRRAEPLSLDLEHVELGSPDGGSARPVAVHAIGKGKTIRERLGLPPETAQALEAWLAIRGRAPGPLFHRLDRPQGGGRLSGRAIGYLVKGIALEAGLTRGTHPHGLRHQAITRALDLTGGDVRKVQRFSRHAKIETVVRYDDHRTDPSHDLACLVAGG